MTIDDVRARLKSALASTGLDPCKLSVDLKRDGQYISRFLNRQVRALEERDERALEQIFGMKSGELHATEEFDAVAEAEFRLRMQEKIQHWTNIGTFKIVTERNAGGQFFSLFLGDVRLREYAYHNEAAESISNGDHDAAIGQRGAALNVPRDPLKWNGLS